ncbi:GNAT family N-acetyltransferase [Cecembia rubra]|uniref:Acetyltransferase (GNAT) family protein n=1 Tax=Cecembia rubra TaxID=1485585 RepID=A0A2P8EE03_9BACT|nr:GNAT family N-acetyltransferase [Cecembia rubra]PSL07710.1 acetyltransferase (GNAT) family protein [Cecembia rubra]
MDNGFLKFKTATSETDLQGILLLQSENHLNNIKDYKEGFVTVKHDFNVLKKMNDLSPHVIALENKTIAGYVLAMTKDSKEDVPILVPMFELFDQLKFKGKKISTYNYLVVGQVCVGKDFRGKGIFDQLYETYKTVHSNKFEFAVTEIATNNLRSLNAHKRIGFREIHRYSDTIPMEWSIVLWDWKS